LGALKRQQVLDHAFDVDAAVEKLVELGVGIGVGAALGLVVAAFRKKREVRNTMQGRPLSRCTSSHRF